MMTFDQIEDAATDYKGLSLDDLDALETDALHHLLSQRVGTECEVATAKKSLMVSANDLLKKIRADVHGVNAEIQRRNEKEPAKPDVCA